MKESKSTPPAPEPCYAHTHPEFSQPEYAAAHWEKLFTDCQNRDCSGLDACCGNCGHLDKVARLTAKFAEEMFPEGSQEAKTARQWGWLAGLWHDLGKFAPEWQAYLKRKVSDLHEDDEVARVDHSTAGALFSIDKLKPFGALLAYVIAGHHAGLADGRNEERSRSTLSERLNSHSREAKLPESIAEAVLSGLPPLKKGGDRKTLPFRLGFFTRMLFSSLVDADFLATESFMNRAQFRERLGGCFKPSWDELIGCLDRTFDAFGRPKNDVYRQREIVRRACLSQANKSVGFFNLTVPTGGGKTLSSMAFALRHAKRNKLDRVIYVIPFTSIIEQNADVFRSVFSDLEQSAEWPIVLEHHSNLEPQKETTRNRLACENWEAPIVVTTNVQFFESLFANRTSRCRKLHNIANSVVIFDEAQNLPLPLLSQSLAALKALRYDFNASLVFCTATQPAIQEREDFPIGLKKVDTCEIIEDVPALFAALKRTRSKHLGVLSDELLLERIRERRSSLTIVNTRRHAAELFEGLGKSEGHYHLSAQMCPLHRSKVISEVRNRRREFPNEICRVVSTQLVEAGVDLDFPAVFRSLTGIDSIAQAAGRCNREGTLEFGEVFTFESEHPIPRGHLRNTADAARHFIESDDLFSPDVVTRYFEYLYYRHSDQWVNDREKMETLFPADASLLGFKFAKAAKEFRLIDQEQLSILVPFNARFYELKARLALPDRFPSRSDLRLAQRTSVQVPQYVFDKLRQASEISAVDSDERFWVLDSSKLYDEKLGLLTNLDAHYADPENLICS